MAGGGGQSEEGGSQDRAMRCRKLAQWSGHTWVMKFHLCESLWNGEFESLI